MVEGSLACWPITSTTMAVASTPSQSRSTCDFCALADKLGKRCLISAEPRHLGGMRHDIAPRLLAYSALVILAAAAGCGSDVGGASNPAVGTTPEGTSGSLSSGGSAGVGGSSTANSGSASTAGVGSGSGEFPCEVQQLLATKCQLC